MVFTATIVEKPKIQRNHYIFYTSICTNKKYPSLDQEICSFCGIRFEPCGCSYDSHWRLTWLLISGSMWLIEVHTNWPDTHIKLKKKHPSQYRHARQNFKNKITLQHDSSNLIISFLFLLPWFDFFCTSQCLLYMISTSNTNFSF